MLPSALTEPWGWLLAGSLAAGAGMGLMLRAFIGIWVGKRSSSTRRSALGFVFLALAVLAATGLLIFPDKAIFADADFLRFSLACLGLGFLAGLFPRLVGIPFVVLGLGASIYVASALDGWLRIGEPRRVATLIIYASDARGLRGELRLEEKDTIPIIQKVELTGGFAGLVVERLELGGPLALVAGKSFYRVVGLSGRNGEEVELSMDFAPPTRLLDIALPLGEGMEASAALPFARRWRVATEPFRIVALEPLRFRLDPALSAAPGLTIEER